MPMEVDLSEPLSDEVIEKLRERYSNEYVDRMIYLSGGTPEEQVEDAGDGASTEAEDESDADTGEDDDLIGDTGAAGNAVGTDYNPGEHTVDEVNKYLRSGVSEEEKQAILQLEREGRGRATILELN